jgi:hypothetical protein
MIGALIAVLAGSGITAMGILVMRNPMHLALLSLGSKGYYQRMVLDRSQRLQLRTVGMLTSFFGLVVLTGALSGALSFKILDTLSYELRVLLSLSFVAAFGFGIIHAVVQLVRGRGKEVVLGWFTLWRRGAELGPIDVYPDITPRMRSESKMFTAAYCVLVAITLVVALVIQ